MSSTTVKILILYDSHAGNVEQMAKLVAEGAREIERTEVRINVDDGPIGPRSHRAMSTRDTAAQPRVRSNGRASSVVMTSARR